MMKAVQTHKPPASPANPSTCPQEHDYDAFLIQFSTRSSGGFAISCDGILASSPSKSSTDPAHRQPQMQTGRNSRRPLVSLLAPAL